MKILKVILIAIVAIVVLVLGAALFVDGDYAVEREVSINKPKSEVFSYLVLLQNQDNFSSWATVDPDMKKEFTGVDGTIGFISAWDSENKDVGKGEQEITAIIDGERIDYELRFLEPFESTDFAYITTASKGEAETEVKWGFTGEMKYPMNLMLLFMDMEEMLGEDLNNGLLKLKEILELVPDTIEEVPSELQLVVPE